MASLLDVGLLDYFAPVFVFLLVFSILFALLEKTNIFGDNRGLNSIVSFALAFLFILTPDLMKVIKIFTPWFVLLFIFVLMVILIFMFVGIKESEVSKAFTEKSVIWVIVIVAVIILIYSMTQVFGAQVHNIYGGENVTEVTAGGLNESIGKILFHPRVLGVIIILFIAAQTVRFLTVRSK